MLSGETEGISLAHTVCIINKQAILIVQFRIIGRAQDTRQGKHDSGPPREGSRANLSVNTIILHVLTLELELYTVLVNVTSDIFVSLP